MITKIGTINISTVRNAKYTQRVEEDGKAVDKEIEVPLTFTLQVPLWAPYNLAFEAVDEMRKELEKMEEDDKRKAKEAAKNNEEREQKDVAEEPEKIKQ